MQFHSQNYSRKPFTSYSTVVDWSINNHPYCDETFDALLKVSVKYFVFIHFNFNSSK